MDQPHALTLDQIRLSDFARLNQSKHVYLDHTGAALYPSRLPIQHVHILNQSLLGNPHSSNPTSKLSTTLVDDTRHRILSFFNTDAQSYSVIFTANASAAAKLVAEAFPFRKSSTLLLLADNHNSVLGTRTYAAKTGATVQYVPLDTQLRAPSASSFLAAKLVRPSSPSLFAFPAQSNFSGVQHPLALVTAARSKGWHVLLDAAAFVPTSKLDLSLIRPDFVIISFYKMFGYPTGVGALIVRNKSLPLLKRPSFSGGTVKFVSVVANIHALYDGIGAFEDGTCNFTGISAVSAGLDFLELVSVDCINAHVKKLTTVLLKKLLELRWTSSKPVVQLYGPSEPVLRGGTVTFNLIAPDATLIDARLVEQAATRANISLRVGCFCNPGAAEHALHLDKRNILSCAKSSQNLPMSQMYQCLGGNDFIGAIRASVGLSSSIDDINRFSNFMNSFCAAFENGQREFENTDIGEWNEVNSSLRPSLEDDKQKERQLTGDSSVTTAVSDDLSTIPVLDPNASPKSLEQRRLRWFSNSVRKVTDVLSVIQS